jgi:hypothetical protein
LKFSKNDTNAIKGIAIILMFFHHCFLDSRRWAAVPYSMLDEVKKITYFPVSFAPFSEKTIVYMASFSKICVPIFVFLTGYGMAVSYQLRKNNSQKYVWNRIVSLMTGFWFVFIITQILCVFTGRYNLIYGKGLVGIIRFIVDGMGLANLFKMPSFNSTWWYMSLAIVLIFIFPTVYRWIQKEDWIVLVTAIILPRALHITTLASDDFLRYFLAYLMGMYFQKRNLLVKIKQFMVGKNKIIKGVIALLLLVLIIKCRQNAYIGWKYLDIWEGVAATYVIIISYVYILNWRYVCRMFQKLGEHSMNMFLIHTFYRDVFFHRFTYSFHNWALIVLVLLVISFLSSVVLEKLKDIIQYQKFPGYLKALIE